MSETKRLIEKERPEKIEERHEDEDGGHGTGESTAATTSGSAVRSKIRRRQSPPYGGTDYGSSASKYGTLDTSAGMKRSLLVDTYPRTHITRKQFAIAFIAFLIFAAAVGVTLILGLPRLDAKRTEYYAAKFYESPVQQEPFHQRSVVVKGSQGKIYYRKLLFLINELFFHLECSRIGESILTRGNGTAMDAALAALYCSLVASPHLVRFDSALTGLYYSNFTATAFSSAFQNIPMPSSNDSLSWPSLIEATRLLSSRFGRAQWANIVNPSVQLATSGAPVSKGLSSFLQAKEHGDLLKQNTTLTNLFSKEVNNSTRAFLGEGDLLRVPGLAETLTLLAQSNGTSQLLEMNKTLQRRLEDDLNITMSPTVSNTTTASSELLQTEVPLSISLLNETLTLLTAPQPALGVALSQILAILDRIILSNQSFIELCNDDNRTLKEGAFEFHYIIEALKFGAATRASLASGSNSTKIASFLDKNKLQEIATKILDFSVYPEAVHSNEYYGFPEVDLVANKESSSVGGLEILVYDGITGESVSLEVINQNGLFDGTKIVSETTGIILNKVKNEHINDQVCLANFYFTFS